MLLISFQFWAWVQLGCQYFKSSLQNSLALKMAPCQSGVLVYPSRRCGECVAVSGPSHYLSDRKSTSQPVVMLTRPLQSQRTVEPDVIASSFQFNRLFWQMRTPRPRAQKSHMRHLFSGSASRHPATVLCCLLHPIGLKQRKGIKLCLQASCQLLLAIEHLLNTFMLLSDPHVTLPFCPYTSHFNVQRRISPSI